MCLIRRNGAANDPPRPPAQQTPGDPGSWHERVEAHLTPDETTQYRLACAMLDEMKSGAARDAADWLPYALNTKDTMTARAIMRMNLLDGLLPPGGDGQ